MRSEREDIIELERYEFSEAPSRIVGLGRRRFLGRMGALGGGIAVFLCTGDAAGQSRGTARGTALGTAHGTASGAGERRAFGFEREALPDNLGAWLHIGEAGAVTVFTGKAEMGQNIRTSLTQAVAEELRAPLASITLVMADTKRTPFDMGTFGSRTTPQMGTRLRRVASVARDSLVELAAQRWGIAPGGLTASEGAVRDPKSGRVVEYAELARGQALAKTVIESDPLEPPAQWTVAGTSVAKINGRDFVTGRHCYSPDVTRPGMLHGKVLRPPSFGATLVLLDAAAARAMPGVVVVHDGDFAGAAAPSEEMAQRAVDSMRAQWKTRPQISDKDLFDDLRRTANKQGSEGRERGNHAAGNFGPAFARSDHRLSQTYTVAYIAHAPLETRAAVAEWRSGKVAAWTGTQRPFAVRDELMQAFRLGESDVRVIVPDTGGAFGGKHTGEAAVEAARLARGAGRPVRLQWTREEEFTWAYFRPAGVIDVKSGAARDGALTAWAFENYNSGGAGLETPYEVPNQRIAFYPCEAPLRQGSYRCLAATANHFARESHMDDVARLVSMDPLDFRRKNLKNPRLLAVLEAACDAFGWGRRQRVSLEKGRGYGLACGTEKGGYLANCAEVSVDRQSGAVKVLRVTSAFECGAIINPDGLKNLITGATVMGLGGALFEAIHFDHGRIVNDKFSRYRVPRFSDVPKIEVILVDRKDIAPAGAGEAPIMCVAPAIRNAILDATGVPLFSMPMIPDGLKA